MTENLTTSWLDKRFSACMQSGKIGNWLCRARMCASKSCGNNKKISKRERLHVHSADGLLTRFTRRWKPLLKPLFTVLSANAAWIQTVKRDRWKHQPPSPRFLRGGASNTSMMCDDPHYISRTHTYFSRGRHWKWTLLKPLFCIFQRWRLRIVH